MPAKPKIHVTGSGAPPAAWCPGCDTFHHLRGDWNGDADCPTFSAPQRNPGCNAWIVYGRMQFMSGTTHALAGKTVDVPDWPLTPGGVSVSAGVAS